MTASPPASPALATAVANWGQASVANQTGGGLVYDPLGFYVKATDIKGHGERVGFKCPPDIYAQVMKMVYSPDYPEYDSPPDFFRDGAVHLLHWRAEQITDPRWRDVIGDILARLDYRRFLTKIEAESLEWEQSHDKLRELLTRLANDGAWGQIVAYLITAEEHLDPAPEPYRSRGLEVLDEWRAKIPAKFLTQSA